MRTFMMNFCKITLMMFFAFLTALCVSYAHSEEVGPAQRIEIYSTSNWLYDDCKLRVEHLGSEVRFTAIPYSKSAFIGFWPTGAGEVDLYVNRRREGDQIANQLLEENLKVQFEKTGERVVPVSYIYNGSSTEPNSPLNKSEVCFGIQKR